MKMWTVPNPLPHLCFGIRRVVEIAGISAGVNVGKCDYIIVLLKQTVNVALQQITFG